jgi:hypothetical protein
MEDVMHIDKVHRRTNGTIDIDFYRRESFFLRREATNKFFRGVGQLARSLSGAVTFVITYVLLKPRDPPSPGVRSIFVSANVPPASN